MRRRLGDLSITRRYAPLLIWVTSLKLYEHKHILHCGIRMWQNNPKIGWADLHFFSPTFRNKFTSWNSLVLCMHPLYQKVQSGVRSPLNLPGKYFWRQKEPSISISQTTEINPDRTRKGTHKRTSSLSMSSLCSKILHVQLIIFHSDFHWMESLRYFLSVAFFLENSKQIKTRSCLVARDTSKTFHRRVTDKNLIMDCRFRVLRSKLHEKMENWVLKIEKQPPNLLLQTFETYYW